MSLVPIKEVDKPVNTVLVKYLEEMVQDAKSGDMVAITWVCLWSEHKASNGWAGLLSVAPNSVIGELEILKAELVQNEIKRIAALNGE